MKKYLLILKIASGLIFLLAVCFFAYRYYISRKPTSFQLPNHVRAYHRETHPASTIPPICQIPNEDFLNIVTSSQIQTLKIFYYKKSALGLDYDPQKIILLKNLSSHDLLEALKVIDVTVPICYELFNDNYRSSLLTVALTHSAILRLSRGTIEFKRDQVLLNANPTLPEVFISIDLDSHMLPQTERIRLIPVQ